jgi:5-methylcytosine-specific restriction endonuclease McrA
MSRWSRLADSRGYRRYLGEIKATGATCVLCGHPGSTSVHHLIPPSRFPEMAKELASDPANWAPAHGVEGCPTCGRRCNQSQGDSLTPKHSPRSRRW